MSNSILQQHADLARFAQEFRDEAHLRTVLRDLLVRMGATRVRITHAPNERGKDIVFYKTGGLSADVLYACVVKKDRISGRADSGGGAQTVFNQACQALREPYTDPISGSQETPHSVYVMCPNECTPEAVESIKTQLHDQARRVQFLCGVDLLALFQEHYSDFLRFESAVLMRYLSSLSAGLSVDSALIALLTRNNANLGLKPFDKFYVSNQIEVRLDRLRAPTIPLPWTKTLDQHLIPSELEDFVAQVRFWKQILRSPELADEKPGVLNELKKKLDEFCRSAREYWDRGHKTGRPRLAPTDPSQASTYRDTRPHVTATQRGKQSEDAKTEGRARPQEERVVAVPFEIRRSLDVFFQIVERTNEKLHRIEEASMEVRQAGARLAEANGKLLAMPQSTLVSAGYDYLNAIPGLIKQEVGKQLPVKPAVLFSECRAVLVTGPPGSGKTSFCRWHTLRAIDRFSADWSQPLPLYVSAHRLAPLSGGFEETFLGGVNVAELWPTDEMKVKVPILLFLDGLDEVPDREQQQRIIKTLQEGLEKYPRLVAIVTARPYVWGAWLNWLPRLNIAELAATEQRMLAECWLDDASLAQRFFEQLRSSPALQKLMGVPLLATLILNLYRRTPTIPENKASLYRAFVDLYCGGWEVAKGIPKTGHFANEQKMRPLPGLAYRMHLSHKADCTEDLFRRVLQDTMPGLALQVTDLLGEIIQDGILVRIGNDLVFAHLSFQEYLAAQYLASDPRGNRPAHALNSFLRGEDWWKEILEFYMISRDDPSGLDDWIRRSSGGVGTREKRDDDQVSGNNEILTRLDSLAKILSETFSGYSPKFNQRRERRVRAFR